MFQLAAEGSLEQPQAAGIPEKALHFTFPPCSAFPVLWAWAPPLPPLSSLKCAWGWWKCQSGIWELCWDLHFWALEVAGDKISHAGLIGWLRNFNPAVPCAGGKGNQPVGASAFLRFLIRGSEVINQPPSISGGSDLESDSVLMHLFFKKEKLFFKILLEEVVFPADWDLLCFPSGGSRRIPAALPPLQTLVKTVVMLQVAHAYIVFILTDCNVLHKCN